MPAIRVSSPQNECDRAQITRHKDDGWTIAYRNRLFHYHLDGPELDDMNVNMNDLVGDYVLDADGFAHVTPHLRWCVTLDMLSIQQNDLETRIEINPLAYV